MQTNCKNVVENSYMTGYNLLRVNTCIGSVASDEYNSRLSLRLFILYDHSMKYIVRCYKIVTSTLCNVQNTSHSQVSLTTPKPSHVHKDTINHYHTFAPETLKRLTTHIKCLLLMEVH